MAENLELSDDRQLIFLHSIKEDLQNVYDHFRQLEYQIEYLKKENESLKSDHYKDEQLANLEKKYKTLKEMCHLGFPITKEEHEKIMKWEDEIIGDNIMKIDSVRFVYEFQPTPLGVIGKVKDLRTGESFTFHELD